MGNKLSLRYKNKVKKVYTDSPKRFKKKTKLKQIIRKKDVDEVIYYPNRTIKSILK